MVEPSNVQVEPRYSPEHLPARTKCIRVRCGEVSCKMSVSSCYSLFVDVPTGTKLCNSPCFNTNTAREGGGISFCLL